MTVRTWKEASTGKSGNCILSKTDNYLSPTSLPRKSLKKGQNRGKIIPLKDCSTVFS
jgi:hypothetical protein